MNELLNLENPVEQSLRLQPNTALGRALDRALAQIMSQENLTSLFGNKATANRVQSFSDHFAQRIRHSIASIPAASNPYLWQLLAGRFSPKTVYPWLTAPPVAEMPEVRFTNATMEEALKEGPRGYDFIHLSNILDWLSPDEASGLLETAWSALCPGGYLLIRQLNSNLDVRALSEKFEWKEDAERMHHEDRSFFYQRLHLGRK